jgi:hypothetical protein
MRYLTLFATVVMLIPQEPERHDQYRDDPVAYCYNLKTSGTQGPKRQRDPHAHACTCHLLCTLGPDNSVIGDQESSNCELFCTRTHCTCHVEEPCEGH